MFIWGSCGSSIVVVKIVVAAAVAVAVAIASVAALAVEVTVVVVVVFVAPYIVLIVVVTEAVVSQFHKIGCFVNGYIYFSRKRSFWGKEIGFEWTFVAPTLRAHIVLVACHA